MQTLDVSISENFKKMTIRAILAIALFVFTYILLICLSLGLTIISAYGGLMLIVFRPSFITLMLGAGLISMAVLVLIFLVKFIFKKHSIDRSGLVEIKREQEPHLFSFIQSIVDEVQTDFPKKIYLSSDVNACVFYDSNFWSMFFPVKKNLQIGLGLANAVSVLEFKAILAHEFGHFSQRSMKVGSYVYNVNQVIYNMLYDNESYLSLAERWGNINGYFAIFVNLAVKIVQAIQWLLKKVYEIVNITYMSLSREMEFHADEVAANVTGTSPLITSLLRMDLADYSYQTVLNHYNSRIKDGIKTENIFEQQSYIMQFLAKESKLPIENGFPQVNLAYLNRFNKSKLVIKDQWASHPSTEDRIAALEKLNIYKEKENIAPAIDLFKNVKETASQMTQSLFATVNYGVPIKFQNQEEFITAFDTDYKAGTFHEIYNHYYDDKNPVKFEVEAIALEAYENKKTIDKLFDNQIIDLVYSMIALNKDLYIIQQIANESFKIKTFDYDGNKYKKRDCNKLIPKLEKELERLSKEIEENDIAIYRYFLAEAKSIDKGENIINLYKTFFAMDADVAHKQNIGRDISQAAKFIYEDNSIERATQKALSLRQVEQSFKKEIQDLLQKDIYQDSLNEEIKEYFTNYLSKEWTYFQTDRYDNDALNALFTSINAYQFILSDTYFKVKKTLLDFQAKLVLNKAEA
jgi:Zn-dependent protease with chaperone function